MTNSSAQTEKEIRLRIVDDILGVASFTAPLVALVLIYRIISQSSPVGFLISAILLLLIPLLFVFRQKITFAVKLGLLLFIGAVTLVLSMSNGGLLGIGPLLLAIFNMFAISLFGNSHFGKVVGLTILLLSLAVIGHYLDLFPRTTFELADGAALINRTISVALLFSVLLVVHRRLMRSLSQLSEDTDRQNQQLQDKNRELEDALNQITTLENMLSVCAWCKKVEESPGSGNWISMQQYMEKQTQLTLSHGLCKKCYGKKLQEIADA
jgi:hypothetical protein